MLPIQLPKPQTDLDFPLMKALEQRRTKRKWKENDLSDQELSNLLWSASGITYPEQKGSKCRRTVPSARNAQCISVFIALRKGVFIYDAKYHSLLPRMDEDILNHQGTQKMIKLAPASLIYVADFSKLKGYTGINDDRKWFVAGTEVGFMSQNVYLYCASANLNTVIVGLVDRANLHTILKLKETEKVIYTQAIGYSPN